MTNPIAPIHKFSTVGTLADIARYHAGLNPDAVALSFEGRETTYRGLDAASSRVANGLIAGGVKASGRVAILDKNSDRFFEIWFGAAKANVVLVPINARLAGPEIAFVLNDAEAEVLFVGESFLNTLGKIRDQLISVRKIIVVDGSYAEWRDAQADHDPRLAARSSDVCVQLYTSGTTGQPKGVELTNANLVGALPSTIEAWGKWTIEDVLLLAMPLFHIAGCGTGVLGLLSGLKTIIVREFAPQQILETIESARVTIAFLVPAMLLTLMSEKNIEQTDLSSLRRIIYGASPIPLELMRSALRLFQHTGFVQIYGLTETTGVLTVLAPEDHSIADTAVMKSCGRATAGVELRIVDTQGTPLAPRQVGEIICRTAKNMKGYWNRTDETAKTLKDGWLRTGDVGYLDESGYLYIHDRLKDMIVSGGENIYPAEIERALYGHPDIADIAVVGVPDERWGEAAKALVVVKQNRTADAADILRYARERLAGYKIPKSIEFLPELPRNSSGKILKRALREQYWRGRERRVN